MNSMDKKNAFFTGNQDIEESAIDFDELEEKLQSQLDEQLSELDFLESEKAQIGNPDALGETIKNVVWEQFINQIGVIAGEDFIEYDSLINIRSWQGNPSRDVLDPEVREKIRQIVEQFIIG